MSDLQLGLLAIGVLLVVGVFAYNWRQESVARRAAEKASPRGHADARTQPEPSRPGTAAAERPAAHSVTRAPSASTEALPDSRIDYVVELTFGTPITAGMLVQQWKANEHRYAG